MAKGSIATAWIQVLPSLEGLQSALVKASKGAVLTPAVQPKLASGTSRLFASHGLGMSKLFSGSFNKSLNLQGGVKGALNGVFASFTAGGRRSANAFGDSFANLDLGKYLNTAAAIVAVASVGKAVKNVTSNIIEMGNQWGRTTAMLKNAVGDTGDYKDSLETSLKYANKVGVATDDFVQSAARLRTLAPEVVTNYADAAKFTKLLDMNMVSTGASTQEASSAMRQITQALGKGIVNGDELTSIMENSPQIARMLAKHLNVSVGELKQLGKEGKISGQALYDTVLENADAIEKQFAAMPVTADRAWNSIKNTVGVRSAEAATALSVNVGKALTAISDSGMVDTFGEMLAGFVPLSNAASNLAATFINQLAPAVNKAFNAQQVEQFLAPLTNLISLNSQNANLLSSLGDALNTVGVIGTTVFSLMVATNDRFASRIPFIGTALVGVKNTLIKLGSGFTSAFGAAVSASSTAIDKLASMADAMSKMLSESTRAQNALGKFNVAFEDLGSHAFSFGEKGAEGFDIVQKAATNLRNGIGHASDNVKLLQNGLNAMGSDAEALPEAFLKAFETLGTEMDAAARKKAPSLVQAFRDIRTAADTIVVDSGIYRSLDVAGQDADIYRDKLVQVGREFKELTGFKIPNVFLPLVGSAVSASDSIMQTFGNLKSGLSNYAANTAQQWAPVKDILAEIVSNAKTKMEVLRADVESGVLTMVENVKGKAAEFKTVFDEMLDSTGISDTMSKLGSAVSSGLSSVKGVLKSFGAEAASTLAFPFRGIPEKIFGSFKGQNPFTPLTSAAKTVGAGLSATFGGAVSRLVGRFSPLASAGKAAFATIGSAALKVSSGALRGFGAAVNGVGAAIGKIGGIASQLGVTGAIFTGLTAGFQTLFKLDPSQMSGKFDEWQKSLDSALIGVQTKLPAMASAFAAALPQMVSSVTSALPGIANALVSVGQTLGPALMTMLPQITQAFSGMFAQLPTFISTYGQPMLEAFGALFATLAGQIPSLMTSLGQALVAGVQVAFSAIGDNSGAIAGFISGFGASLASGIQTLGATIVAALPSIGQSIASALPTLIPALMSSITGVITSLASALPGIAVAIINQLPAIIGGLATGIVNGLPTLLNAFISVVTSIASNFPGIFMAVVGAIPAIIGNIARPFAGLGGRILGFIGGIPGQIIGMFAGAGSWLINSGAALMNGFKQGIVNAVEGVKSAVSGALQKVRDFFPFSPAKVGPFSGSGYTSVSGEHLMRDFGKAIGAQGAFVRGQVDGVLGSLDFDQIDADGLGVVSAPQLKDYTGMVAAGDQRYAGGVHIDNVVASPLSDVELVARRFGYALNNEMIGSVRP
jgi:tape measure domain-containing protein|nr:MAG TPA: Tail tape measure [Caudoviricetes sp.]